jgi:hypothetical protein
VNECKLISEQGIAGKLFYDEIKLLFPVKNCNYDGQVCSALTNLPIRSNDTVGPIDYGREC